MGEWEPVSRELRGSCKPMHTNHRQRLPLEALAAPAPSPPPTHHSAPAPFTARTRRCASADNGPLVTLGRVAAGSNDPVRAPAALGAHQSGSSREVKADGELAGLGAVGHQGQQAA